MATLAEKLRTCLTLDATLGGGIFVHNDDDTATVMVVQLSGGDIEDIADALEEHDDVTSCAANTVDALNAELDAAKTEVAALKAKLEERAADALPTRGDLETVLLAVLDETDVPLGDEHAHALAEAVGEYHLTSADGIGRPLGFAEAVAGAARLIRGDDAGDGLDALAIVTAERDALRAQLRAALADVEQARRDEANVDAITKARIEDVVRLEAELADLKKVLATASGVISSIAGLQLVRSVAETFEPFKVADGEEGG